MEALDDEEIKVFDKLCRKIAKLNESTMSLPRNFRSLSLNTCYLKSLLIVMPLLMSNKILNQINSEDTTDKENGQHQGPCLDDSGREQGYQGYRHRR